MFTQNFILNGQANGEIAESLAGVRFDPGMLRPYFDSKGRPAVTVNQNGRPHEVLIKDLRANGIDHPTWNATSLRKEDWIELDRAVIAPVRLRQRFWADLMAASSFGGFNAMGKMVLETEAQSDPGRAVVDMDGLSDGYADTPKFQLQGLPLPITHSDFWYSKRRLLVSQNSGTPLDTRMGEAAGTRVAEEIERTAIGTDTGVSYGGTGPYSSGSGMLYPQTSQVYGLLNFPYRTTSITLTAPTGSNPEVTVADVLNMRSTLYGNRYYGPFMIYHSTDWDQYLDNDYARLGGNNANTTLRRRLREIEGVLDVRRLDFMAPTDTNSHTFTMVMLEMTSKVCRAINGMAVTTIQWESKGGMQLNFKVMAIQVPQFFAQYSGNTYGSCGIVHAHN